MEYDETFVCPNCKQDYDVIDFDIKSLKLNTYYVTFACVNNSCKNINGDVVKTLSRIEIRNLLSEGYTHMYDFWKKIRKEYK
jgi:hypothetical protein